MMINTNNTNTNIILLYYNMLREKNMFAAMENTPFPGSHWQQKTGFHFLPLDATDDWALGLQGNFLCAII